MKVVIVSDDPDGPSFYPIRKFKVEIEGLLGKRVDLISISQKAIYLDKTKKLNISDNTDMKKRLKEIFQTMNYNFYIFSLNSDNLSILLGNKSNILDFIESSGVEIYVFGAWSKLKSFQWGDIHLFRRPGVSKLTKEFKERVLSKMNSKLKSVELNNNPCSTKSHKIGSEN